eukprot:m.148825 g.148825  ORF g.148825 m.148825 type:complete len:233 (-) comp17801_c0_seq34:3783-4481(-)
MSSGTHTRASRRLHKKPTQKDSVEPRIETSQHEAADPITDSVPQPQDQNTKHRDLENRAARVERWITSLRWYFNGVEDTLLLLHDAFVDHRSDKWLLVHAVLFSVLVVWLRYSERTFLSMVFLAAASWHLLLAVTTSPIMQTKLQSLSQGWKARSQLSSVYTDAAKLIVEVQEFAAFALEYRSERPVPFCAMGVGGACVMYGITRYFGTTLPILALGMWVLVRLAGPTSLIS